MARDRVELQLPDYDVCVQSRRLPECLHRRAFDGGVPVRIVPIVYQWREVEVINPDDGTVDRVLAHVPVPRYRKAAAAQFASGEEYPLIKLQPRDMRSHNHYFAAVGNAFDNLPEKIAARFPSAEHLRKWALIETNWFDEKEFDCPDEKFARRLGTFIRTEDEYARISFHASGRTWKVIVRRAKSQAVLELGAEDFKQSKKDVLDLLEAMTSVPKGSLMKHAGRSA